MQKLCIIPALALLIAAPAAAEEVHLTADERVEWHQNEQKMVAVGNAVATKQDMNIRADRMTAFYETSKKGGEKARSNIRDVHAVGGVVMTSPNAKAYGDTMDYDLIKDEMILRGKPVSKIVTNDNKTITATESITYYPSQDKAVALGDVVAKDPENTIYGNKMISFFTKNAQNQTELDKVEIYSDTNQVKIVNDQATVTGEWGVYLPKINKVRLYKHVVINQEGNILNGDYAETDLKTGISRVLSDKKSGKRVSGVFIEKDKEAEKNNAPQKKQPTADKAENKTNADKAGDKSPDWSLKEKE